jgi:hypothetical protein
MFIKILLFLGDILSSFKSLLGELSVLFDNISSTEIYIIIRSIFYYLRAEENRAQLIIIFLIIITLVWFLSKKDNN